MLKWIYRHIDIALYVGKHNYLYYRKAGLKANQLIYAPHAVDNQRFLIAAQSPEAFSYFRKQLAIPEDAFVYLFAGKLEPKKNPDILLKAFVDAGFSKDVHLVLVGNGPLEQDLKSYYGGNDSIHFLEFQNQTRMPFVYSMADVVVLPSKGPGETWGLALNEAMACGKAIIASDRCGASADVVKNNVNGFVFRATETGDLKNAMLRLAGKQTALNMGVASLQIIEEFSIARIAKAIEQAVIAQN